MNELTVERLRELLDYDPETGVFRWRPLPIIARTTMYRRKSGKTGRDWKVAGSGSGDSYREISVESHRYLAHRLAWLYVYGAWPKGDIDHKNRIKSDNRLCNLRECSSRQNTANSYFQATGRFKGTCWYNGKWAARINFSGKQRHLGFFDDRHEAALAYAYAAYGIHGEFARPHWRALLADMRGVVSP